MVQKAVDMIPYASLAVVSIGAVLLFGIVRTLRHSRAPIVARYGSAVLGKCDERTDARKKTDNKKKYIYCV